MDFFLILSLNLNLDLCKSGRVAPVDCQKGAGKV